MVGLREHTAPREARVALPPPRTRLQSVAPPGRSVPPEPAAPELDVRLHTPRAEVVVVRVAGTVDERGADLLEERVGQQLARAHHVVVDLTEVPDLPACGTRALADLARDAHRHGTCLHIAGVEDPAVRDRVRLLHLDCAPCADAVVALLPRTFPRRRRLR